MSASKRKLAVIIFQAVIFLALLLLSASTLQAEEKEAEYDTYFRPYLETGNFSGAVLVAKDGEIIFSKGYGFASFELNVPISVDTKFPLGSIGKQLAAVSIMQLEERGLLSLDDKIKKFIPKYRYGDQITVHNLLTHMSGIPELDESSPYSNRIGASVSSSQEERIKLLGKQRLEFRPGTQYRYTNIGYWLLSVIVENVSGEPYNRYVEKNILEPLEMNDTVFDMGQIIENRALGHYMTHKGLVKAYYFETPRTGAIFTTVGDLYKFNNGILRGKLLKPSSVEKMTTRHNEVYGYAWFVDATPGNRIVWHGGVSPGYRATVYNFLDKGLTLIVFSNVFNTPLNKIRADLAAIAEGGEYLVPDVRKMVVVDGEIMEQYTGSYKDSEGYVANIIREDDGLFLVITHESRNLGTSLSTRMALYPRAKNSFFPMEMNADLIFRSDGDKKARSLDFVIEGRATRMDRFRDRPVLPTGPPSRREEPDDFR